MLATKGVPPESYVKDGAGHRYGLSPFLHYPDLCTIYTNNEVGECWRECRELEEEKRPCWMRAHGIEIPQPKLEAPKDRFEEIKQNLEKLAQGETVPKTEASSPSPDGFDLGVALDALIEQAGAIQVDDKKAKKELGRLVKGMVLLRGRITGDKNEIKDDKEAAAATG